MPILTVDELKKSFGTRVLFDGVSFSLEEGEKVGLIGFNGAGKSTLFQILAGTEKADAGAIATRRGATIGYMAQEPSFSAGGTIRSAVSGGRPELMQALSDYHTTAERLTAGGPEAARLLERQGALMSRIDALGGWGMGHEVERILSELGLPEPDRPLEGLSGGERKRTALARVLLDQPDLLLLDEPTNHLDADTTLWLENRLLEYRGAVLLITHDRYFLDRVVTRMIEVGTTAFTSYRGGYTEYLEARSERLASAATEASRRDRLLEQELTWVKRSPAARTGKQKARIKRLEAMQSEAAAESPLSTLEIRFGPPPRLGRTVLEIDKVSKSYDGRMLVRDLSTRLRAGERIGVIGPNGAGKTTLLRIVLGQETPDSGTVQLGANSRIAYVDQERQDLDPTLSLYESIGPEEWVTVGERRVHVRSYLESFLFPTSTHELRVGSLSGGERNRLQLARLLLVPANLLVLDEPTNDLDLPTLQVLESALAEFPGCVLVVSHDRFFLDKIATGLLVFEGGGVVHRHEGGYDLYRRLLEEKRALESKPAATKTRPESIVSNKQASKPRRLNYRERMELEGIEAAILAAEADRDLLGERLSDPALYVDTPDQVVSLREQFLAAEARVAGLYSRWAELDELAGI